MKKKIKKGAQKVAGYTWNYLKMTQLFPDFKNKPKEVRNVDNNKRSV